MGHDWQLIRINEGIERTAGPTAWLGDEPIGFYQKRNNYVHWRCCKCGLMTIRGPLRNGVLRQRFKRYVTDAQALVFMKNRPAKSRKPKD